MSKESEISRLDQAKEYFERYYSMAESVKTSEENIEYLKTYIHDNNYVTENFNFKGKITKPLIICGISGIVVAGILFAILGKSFLIISLIIGLAVIFFSSVLVISTIRYQLNAAEQNQREVNDGIKEQIQIIEKRIKEREKLRDDFYKGIQERVGFISIDYLNSIDKIKQIIEDGEAETCEEAVEIFDQKLLLKQMTSIMEESSEKPVVHTAEENKERFGDPLAIIKENKKKNRKKLFGK